MLADWRGVQINTSPQPKEGSTYINTSSARLPFTVEGVIQSDNPKRIETVTVEVEISFVKNEEVRRRHRVQIISHIALSLRRSRIRSARQSAWSGAKCISSVNSCCTCPRYAGEHQGFGELENS